MSFLSSVFLLLSTCFLLLDADMRSYQCWRPLLRAPTSARTPKLLLLRSNILPLTTQARFRTSYSSHPSITRAIFLVWDVRQFSTNPGSVFHSIVMEDKHQVRVTIAAGVLCEMENEAMQVWALWPPQYWVSTKVIGGDSSGEKKKVFYYGICC